MKLITKEIEQKLLANPCGSHDGEGLDAKVIVKFFGGCSATWLVTEADKEGDDWLMILLGEKEEKEAASPVMRIRNRTSRSMETTNRHFKELSNGHGICTWDGSGYGNRRTELAGTFKLCRRSDRRS